MRIGISLQRVGRAIEGVEVGSSSEAGISDVFCLSVAHTIVGGVVVIRTSLSIAACDGGTSCIEVEVTNTLADERILHGVDTTSMIEVLHTLLSIVVVNGCIIARICRGSGSEVGEVLSLILHDIVSCGGSCLRINKGVGGRCGGSKAQCLVGTNSDRVTVDAVFHLAFKSEGSR